LGVPFPQPSSGETRGKKPEKNLELRGGVRTSLAERKKKGVRIGSLNTNKD